MLVVCCARCCSGCNSRMSGLGHFSSLLGALPFSLALSPCPVQQPERPVTTSITCLFLCSRVSQPRHDWHLGLDDFVTGLSSALQDV